MPNNSSAKERKPVGKINPLGVFCFSPLSAAVKIDTST
jgi:hypothetical protein